MSSVYVRDQIKSFIQANLATENLIDLTGEFDNIRDLIAKAGISGTDPWLGLQFIGSDEEVVALNSGNTSGKYREYGSVYLHVVEKARLSVANIILPRTETIRNAFRGQRIGDMLILSVTPPNFEAGATLDFEGGYSSASIIINYQRDLSL